MALLQQENSDLTFSVRRKPTKNHYVQTEMIAQDVDQVLEMAEELRQRSLQDQEHLTALQQQVNRYKQQESEFQRAPTPQQ